MASLTVLEAREVRCDQWGRVGLGDCVSLVFVANLGTRGLVSPTPTQNPTSRVSALRMSCELWQGNNPMRRVQLASRSEPFQKRQKSSLVQTQHTHTHTDRKGGSERIDPQAPARPIFWFESTAPLSNLDCTVVCSSTPQLANMRSGLRGLR